LNKAKRASPVFSLHMNRQTNSTLRTKIRRIRFVIYTNAIHLPRLAIFSYSAFLIMLFPMLISDTAEKCHQSLADPRQMSNTTSSNTSFECSVFSEQCLCRRSSNGTRVPRHRINLLQLHMMRILPSLSFVFQSIALHEFFNDGAECNPVFVRLRWLVSSFVCGAITIGMFCNHCHHINIIVFIFASSFGMLIFGHIEWAKREEAENQVRRNNTVRLNPLLARTDTDPNSWDNVV
jgi:hypothetical protein